MSRRQHILRNLSGIARRSWLGPGVAFFYFTFRQDSSNKSYSHTFGKSIAHTLGPWVHHLKIAPQAHAHDGGRRDHKLGEVVDVVRAPSPRANRRIAVCATNRARERGQEDVRGFVGRVRIETPLTPLDLPHGQDLCVVASSKAWALSQST